MSSRTTREHASRHTSRSPRTIQELSARAGRAGRLFSQQLSSQHRLSAEMELLETRAMLAGDHPSLPGGATPWTATAITLDLGSPIDSPAFGRGSATGAISSGDTGDLFTFTMPTVGQGGKSRDFVTVLADTINASGASTLDSMIEVYSASGVLITTGQSNTGVSIGATTNPTLAKAPDGWAGFEADAGQTYYLRVRTDTTLGGGRTSTGNYILRVDAQSVVMAIDNTTNSTSVLGTGRETSNIAFSQDDVVYQITTPNHARYDSVASFQAVALDSSSPIVNPHFDLYSTGNTQGVVSRLTGDQDAGRQTDAFGVYKVSKNTTYYMRVRSDDYRTSGSGVTGGYTAYVRMAAPEITVDPVTRLGDTGNQAIIGPDLVAGGLIDGTGMRLFRFTAQGTGQGIVTLLGGNLIGGDGVINPAVQMYDENGNSIDFNKALQATAQIQTPIIGGKSYYIVAEGFDSTPDANNNTRDGSVRIFVEAHHTYNPSAGEVVDDHVDNPGSSTLGTLPAWEQATPVRFGEPQLLQERWTQAGQTPVTTTREDHSYFQTGTSTGRINVSGDSDLFQFTTPLSQLSDYAGNFDRVTPSLFVGGNYATAGTSNVDGTAQKRNNIAVWDAGDWFDTGPRDGTQINQVFDGPIDGPIFAQKQWDPDGAGPLRPVLAVAGNFQNVWGLALVNGQLINQLVQASVAFRTYYPPENRYVWSASFGFSRQPNGTYIPTNDPISIPGQIYALEAYDADPNFAGTGAAIDELIIGGDFNFVDDNMLEYKSLVEILWAPAASNSDQGTMFQDNMGGGVFKNTTGATQGIVRAFAVWDPATPRLPDNPAPTSPPSPSQPDAPKSLYIGGLFRRADQPDGVTDIAVASVNNLVRFGKRSAGAAANATNMYVPVFHNLSLINGPADNSEVGPLGGSEGVTGVGGDNGGVFALAVMDSAGQEYTAFAPWGPTALGVQEISERLFIGGSFSRSVLSPTTTSETVTNLVSYDGTNFMPVGNVSSNGAPSVSDGDGEWAGVVRALTVWNPPSGGVTGTAPALVVAADNGSIPVGQKYATSGVVKIWFGGAGLGTIWSTLASNSNGAILSLATIEENEPATGAPFQTLYVGGQFTQLIDSDGNTVTGLNRVARFANFDANTLQWSLGWQGLTSGVAGLSDAPPTESTTTVYSLGTFNDQPPNEVRRNSRPRTRVQVQLSVALESTQTLTAPSFRVFDSNFQLVFTSTPETGNIAINPAFGTNTTQNFEVWGGESYYIDVLGNGGTGRYTVNVITDALPPKDSNEPLDGQYEDSISTITKPVGAGEFVAAPLIPIDTTGFGKNFSREGGGPLGDPTPTSYSSRLYSFDVDGNIRSITEDPAIISKASETHIYQFRAPNDGTVELRIATKQIQGAWQERITNPFTGAAVVVNTKTKVYNSPLHAAIRVFSNDRETGDFVQTGFSDGNPAVTGLFDVQAYPDNQQFNPFDATARLFTRNDPRLVIPVERGRTYFVQVESAFKHLFETNPDLVDWRFATGAYELSIRATNSFNGIDDHQNGQSGLPNNFFDTSIIVDPATGDGSITGQIVNVTSGPFQNPTDTDQFRWYTTASGQVRVTITPTGGLTPRMEIFRQDLTRPATGTGTTPNQAVTVTFTAQQGEALWVLVSGLNGTQGSYTISIEGPGITDDQPFSTATLTDNATPIVGWANAKGLELNRYTGRFGIADGTTGEVEDFSGNIEVPGDRDIFKLTAEAYELATVTVTALDSTLDPYVEVYEIGKDAEGKDIFLKIANNDDSSLGGLNSRTTFSTTPGRTYYVVIEGSLLNQHFGRYTLGVAVAPTDDHPNRTDFPTATEVPITFDAVNFAGTGSADGELERSDDLDLFKFVAPASGEATVVVSRQTGSTLAIGLTLLDSNNQAYGNDRVQYTPGSGGSLSARLTGLVTGQTYYVLVQASTPGSGETSTGEYTVDVTTSLVDDHPNAGQFNLATTVALVGSTNTGTVVGQLVPAGDTDLFKFTTLVNGTALIRVTTPSSTLSPRVVVFNSGQTQTQALNGNGDTASVSFNVSAGETYYVLVQAATGASGAAAAGNYTLAISNTASGSTGLDDYPDAGEWNDASNIGLDSGTGLGAVNGTIDAGGDTDLFQITPAASGNVQLLLSVPAGSTLDGSLEVYNSSRVLIFSDSVGVGGSTAAINFTGTASEQYFVLVRPVGSTSGTYTLQVSAPALTSTVFYPEGFSSATVDEFVPIVNTNPFPVTYQLFARYESGANPDTPIASGTIAANTKSGVTITTRANLGGALVRAGVGYALELRSSAPLGATISHFDASASLGESFTSVTSTTWTFAEVHKDRANFRDYLLFYNPGNTSSSITMEVFYADGFTTSFTASLESMRRGGFNIDQMGSGLRDGTFGVKITSSTPIVAALSSYNLPRSGGDTMLGEAGGGATRGAMPGIRSGEGVVSNFSILNTNSSEATVNVVVSYARIDLPAVTRTIVVPAHATYTATYESLGLIAGQNAGVRYTSDRAVTLGSFEYQFGDADWTNTATSATRSYVFSDVVIDPTQAGVNYVQRLSLYNPTSSAITVSTVYVFSDGTTTATTVRVEANDFAFVQVDQQAAVLGRTGTASFGLKLDASQPFVSSLVTYNLLLNGGWGQQGQAVGLLTPLSSIA